MKLNTYAPTLKQAARFSLDLPADHCGLLVVGDCPYDAKEQLPFTNSHFGTLARLLRHSCGLDISSVATAGLLNYYPLNGVFQESDYGVARAGAEAIVDYATKSGIKVILILGRQTLEFFKRDASGLDDERGAPWQVCPTMVGLATLHPREVFREWHMLRVVENDFKKAARYLTSGWQPKTYDINYQPSFADCVMFLQNVIRTKPYLSVDIETTIPFKKVQIERAERLGVELRELEYVTCIGFGLGTSKAFVIPFQDAKNDHYFTLQQECLIWRLLARALETGRFYGHNAVHFDHWFLAYWVGINANIQGDTMFAQWECYVEMEKSLAFCNSLYCHNPYWKDVLKLAREGKIPRTEEFRYNGLDCCTTTEVATELARELSERPPAVKQHYEFNITLSRVYQYMSLRGCYVNRDLLSTRITELKRQAEDEEIKLHAQAKRDINVKSPQQMKKWLYDDMMLPQKFKLVKQDDGSMEERETADFLSVMYLAREYPDIPALHTAAMLRKLYKRISSLEAIKLGPKGECYWNFSVVGTDTGRSAGYKPYCGKGVQPQNPDKRDRDLYIPHSDLEFDLSDLQWLKADLEGADAWTVAAQMVTLGDDTMFEDLKAGLKPALILALAYTFGEHYINADRATLVAAVKQYKAHFKTPEGKKQYDTTKAVSHGTNYMMQEPTMHVTIFRKSLGELYVPIKECTHLKNLYLKRYPGLATLHAHIPTMLTADGYMDCPSGMRRISFDRPSNERTRKFLALLPQNNTGYATNRAALNLFYRAYNRVAGTRRLWIAPINQVHDELCAVFPRSELGRCRSIFEQATDFPSTCWGVDFKIPFDANFGANWGAANEEF